MAVLTLPTTPAPSGMAIGILSASNVLESAVGSDEQEIRRLGSRYALTFRMPLMSYSTSMLWSDLVSEGNLVLMRVHQPGFDTGSPGTPRVKGAGQSGASLLIDGLTPGYVIAKGQFLSIVIGGQRFLHRADAAVTADEDGEATVVLKELLRRQPADNAVVEIAQPMVEGYARDVSPVEVGTDRLVKLEFTVRERA